MLCVISPAKKLDWSEHPQIATTDPMFSKEAASLARTGRNLTLEQLQSLMDISPDLARLNRDRFKAYQDTPSADVTRPAALAFAGDTYQGLEAKSLDPEDLNYAQDRLRILSGLYGVLRPKDAMQPYRLEMGSKLKTRRGGTLYAYWGDTLSKALNNLAQEAGTHLLLNCASQEYFGAVDPKALKMRVITPVFLEEKNGQAKTVSFYAKRARGAMARFMIQNRVQSVDGLQDFDTGGYMFQPSQSDGQRLVFSRPSPT